MSDTWSKNFYKALEAVGNLTEQERLKLGQMLNSLNGFKDNPKFVSREIPPPPPPPPTRLIKGDKLIPDKPIYPPKKP